MCSYVRALYEFTGEPGSTELSINVGEVLAVTRTDVGEGWWEGRNNRGEIGLFPAAYVEVMSAAEAKQQQQHQQQQQQTSQNRYDQTADDLNDADEWDDDWDDDNDTYSEIVPTQNIQQQQQQHQQQGYSNYQFNNITTHSNDDFDNKFLPTIPPPDNIPIATNLTSNNSNNINNNVNSTTLKKSSMFAKSSDSFIMGLGNKDKVPESELAVIIPFDNYYQWQPNQHQYTVLVASPKKESKFKGMKTYIAYQLTPSFNNIPVFRRYKHFDWLHERLVEKFCLIPIPPLPDKQISGRYDEQFIEHRRVQLQEFVDWMCRHPVLSKCEVWYHFLTCTEGKIWKSGKRKAERDAYVGIAYCYAISPPEKQLLQSYIDNHMESCSQFIHAMDVSVRNLLAISNEVTKRYQTQTKKEFQRIGEGLADLSRALVIDEKRAPSVMMTGTSGNSAGGTSDSLSNSVGKIADIYVSLGLQFGEQPKYDWIPFSDRLYIYRGILNSYPDILSTHKGALQKKKECERLTSEQKMTNLQMESVNRRTDIVSYAILAEMTHFRFERETHLKNTLKSFIEEQIKFYSNVVSKLQEAYKEFA